MGVMVGTVEQAAVDAMRIALFDPQMPDPRLLAVSRGPLERLVAQVPVGDLRRAAGFNDLRGPLDLHHASRMDGYCSRTMVDTAGQGLDILVVASRLEQRPEVLDELTQGLRRRLAGRAPEIAHSGQVDPVCWKPIAEQLQPDAIGRLVIVEHSE